MGCTEATISITMASTVSCGTVITSLSSVRPCPWMLSLVSVAGWDNPIAVIL